MKFFQELKRRSVLRVVAVYIVTAWLVIQVVETIFPAFGFGDQAIRFTVILLAVGLVPVVVFAWVFEVTPEGIKRDAGALPEPAAPGKLRTRLDRSILVILTLALAYFAFDKFVLAPHPLEELTGMEIEEEAAFETNKVLGQPAIAVLSFSDMSPQKDQEYLSDGIAEELLNLLSKIPELQVISRSSAFSFKGKNIPLPAIAKELNVSHILEGSVRKSGNQIRITAQLIDAASDTHIWSESYDRPLENVFAIQDEIATAVVEELKITLLGTLPAPPPTAPEVYSLYLQGKYLYNQRGRENLEKARLAYDQALSLDPEYAPAWLGISMVYADLARSGWITRSDGEKLARKAVERALEIDSNSAFAWSSLAYLIRSYDWDWEGASAAIDRAMELEPNSADVLGAAASIANTLGQNSRSIELFEGAVRADPLHLGNLRALARRYMKARRFDDAITTLNRVVALQPDYPWGYLDLGLAYQLKGDLGKALEEMEKSPPGELNDYYIAPALYALGQKEEARQLLNDLEQSTPPAFTMAMAYAAARMDEVDLSFEWLNKAFLARDPNLTFILGFYDLDNLENDPRYFLLLEKMNLLERWKAMQAAEAP